MKKKIVILTALVILAVATTFANDNEIGKNALSTFSETFTKATNVKWERNSHYYAASFQMNGQSLTALLSENGDMIAVSRNILSTEMPLHLQTTLARDYSAYWISDLVEYAVGSETRYYVTVEDADKKIVLESVNTYDWTLVKKIVK